MMLKTVLVVQCRLSSSRLYAKALERLCGISVLEYVLKSMKKVPCNDYYLATDKDSYFQLEPIATSIGYKVLIGSLDNVLERFCMVIEDSRADIIVRATADNPFLLYEAATSLKEEYQAQYEAGIDYMTYTGLPHGCGVEVFSAKSLLASRTTATSYDTEHVGPALYKHEDRFRCLFTPSPSIWQGDFRTTIDTVSDLKKARMLARYIVHSRGKTAQELAPFCAKDILEAALDITVKRPVLLLPSTTKGRGTGHLRRSLKLASKLHCDIYVEQEASLKEASELVEEYIACKLVESEQVIQRLPHKNEYAAIITDSFCMTRHFIEDIAKIAPIISIDEGTKFGDKIAFAFDIIPSINSKKRVANDTRYDLLDLPVNCKKHSTKSPRTIHKILVSFGGEDPEHFGKRVYSILVRSGYDTTLVGEGHFVPNLKETLWQYDLVITHYGFTAFEAAFSGCGVLLLPTTHLHYLLAKTHGFYCLKSRKFSANSLLESLTKHTKDLFKDNKFRHIKTGDTDIVKYTRSVIGGKFASCPVCSNDKMQYIEDKVIARLPQKTYRRCSKCGIIYLSYIMQEAKTQYNADYFFADYKKQYGKTYQEDLPNIIAQCNRRLREAASLLSVKKENATYLDAGCALGASLLASEQIGLNASNVYGVDISQEAVDLCKDKGLNVVCSSFIDCDSEKVFLQKQFDILSMWYVIEHFENLHDLLQKAADLLHKGGVFAFATPNAKGISARKNKTKFFLQSPKDHYTIWDKSILKKVLKPFGFTVKKIVVSGVHEERFPAFLRGRLCHIVSKIFCLGDTFEIYCKKD